jgi:predicted nucleic acid-binding protein
VSRWYLDTSAALKLLVEEVESDALARLVDAEQPDLVASMLLETELRRVAQRTTGLDQAMVTDFLDGVSLYDTPPSIFREAGVLPGAGLRSLDALHLASALRLGVDRVLTYDLRMTESCRQLGLVVLAPT